MTIKRPKVIGRYLREPNECPFCDSDHIVGGSVNIEGIQAFQSLSCNECNAAWVDEYILVGYTVTDDPDTE